MRILFCNFEYPPLGGGGGVVNALLAGEIAKHHKVTVLTSNGGNLPWKEYENGVEIVRVPVFFRNQESVSNVLSLLAFIPMGIQVGKNLLRRNRYDIINTHFVLPTGPVGDALSRFAGIPNVLTLHGGDLYDPSKFTSPHRHPLLRAWIRRLLKRADIVVGQSKNTLENMQRFYAPEIQAVRIPLGIQRPHVARASRGDYGFRENEFLMATVGRLVPRKAITQLISMMDTLKDQTVRLLIIGTGPEENILRSESRKRRLEDRIYFMGQVEEREKIAILQMCDIYVSTSQHEGFGLVFLEAMACGLPIMCYDCGGQTDFLQDQENGYLVLLNNLDVFAKRCELLIGNAVLRKRIGENNRRCVEEYYIDRCALSYETTFDKVLHMNANAKRAKRHFSTHQATEQKG